jgi:hypothetical protein
MPLERLETSMRRLQSRPGLGSRAFGVPEWDWELWRMGRSWLAAHSGDLDARPDDADQRPDVYLATHVYELGGHTALIGDFVRALDRPAHLVLTDLSTSPSSTVSAKILARVGLSASSVTVLPGPSSMDRLQQLFAALLSLKAHRLFLFHHPYDPLPSVVAQPEIADQHVLVHHADATPSFAMHLPGIRTIDLNPLAAATTRLLGGHPELLPLTSPDPGPRPHGFLTRGYLVTASSGSPHKFSTPYAFGYADTVRHILSTTNGWHVHIGPLLDSTLAEIAGALYQASLPSDRFVHVPWTASVPVALWEHRCDLYLASFPIDGARTKVDVMASATPYLSHTMRPDMEPRDDVATAHGDGSLRWHTWDNLTRTLREMCNVEALQQRAGLVRQSYERTHHPGVFAETLARILAGGKGQEDPRQDESDRRALHGMMRALLSVARRDSDE